MSRARRRRSKLSPELRATIHSINAMKRAHAALQGKRALRVSLNTDETVTIICALATYGRWQTDAERQELYELAKRIYSVPDSAWLKGLFIPALSQQPQQAVTGDQR